ncbi:hypothetical protein SAMN04488056_11018 [Cohaesibacter marisflavi]|uniref:Uncharacterized protein n=1 Tax=Cohaesibacter marisflavi TaxID=655353 RepID=A0A1I5IVZ8_9HYPH|nr:hypothetical protein [Cohaesibacter marisflavi]SFO64754.1 hypothetical protein SAMN04488056_11018 [Cohaesibacter marisflavi]
MPFEKSGDLNWHHKEIVLLDLKWVSKTIVVHVEMNQFGDQDHQGHAPTIILTRESNGRKEDVLMVSGRAHGHALVSLDQQDRLVARINQSNPHSAGTVKWQIVC